MAYLRSIFPGRFETADTRTPAPQSASLAPAAAPASARVPGALPAAAYADAALLARERTELLRPAWQLLGHQAEVARPGDFLARDLAGERALIVRDEAQLLRAFRNACPHRPHALEDRERGHLKGPIRCRAHGLAFGWDGRQVEGKATGALAALEWMQHGPLIFVRGVRPGPAVSRLAKPGEGLFGEAPASWQPQALGVVPASFRPLAVRELAVAADWKLLVEAWLDTAPAPTPVGRGRAQGTRAVLAPNQLIEEESGALEILQVIPEAPGRSRLRCFRYCAARGREAHRRWPGRRLAAEIAQAESTQLGMALSGENPEPPAALTPGLEAFHRAIRALLPGPAARSEHA